MTARPLESEGDGEGGGCEGFVLPVLVVTDSEILSGLELNAVDAPIEMFPEGETRGVDDGSPGSDEPEVSGIGRGDVTDAQQRVEGGMSGVEDGGTELGGTEEGGTSGVEDSGPLGGGIEEGETSIESLSSRMWSEAVRV